MFDDVTDLDTARRLLSLLFEARSLARKFKGDVCVTITPSEFTIRILDENRAGETSPLPPNIALVRATMDDPSLSVCAVQVAAALKPMVLAIAAYKAGQ